MNLSASECSSGCESGWTLYLDQSSVSETQWQRGGGVVDEDYGRKGEKKDDNEEEDLSMLSDASSGPPHFNEDEDGNGYFCSSSLASKSAKNSEKKSKNKKHGSKQQRLYLDDTASSHDLSFPKKSLPQSNNQGPRDHVLNFSQGFSATHFKGKSAFQKHLGFFKSSIHGKPPSEEPGGL